MTSGIRLAVDVGSVRIGIARSDPRGVLAVPLDAVPAGPDSARTVAELAREYEAVEVVVGLPIGMNGLEGQAAERARSWAAELSVLAPAPVTLVDERLSTLQAQRGLRDAGRTTRSSRSVIDSASAVVVLQSYLDGQSHLDEQCRAESNEEGPTS